MSTKDFDTLLLFTWTVVTGGRQALCGGGGGLKMFC